MNLFSPLEMSLAQTINNTPQNMFEKKIFTSFPSLWLINTIHIKFHSVNGKVHYPIFLFPEILKTPFPNNNIIMTCQETTVIRNFKSF